MIYNALFWGVPIAALAVYLLLIFFFFISQKDRSIRAFQPILYVLTLWTASSLLMKMQAEPGILLWNKMMMIGVFAAPLCIYIFLSVFTDTIRKGKTIFLGTLTLITLVVNGMGLVVTDAQVIKDVVVAGGQTITHTEFVYQLGAWAIPSYVLMSCVVFAIVNKVRSCVMVHEIEFKIISPILLGVLITYVGLFFNLIPTVGKYPIDILAAFINGLLIIYAIYRNRMFEMKFMITRGLVFSVFAAILMGVYFALAYHLSDVAEGFGVKSSTAILVVAFAVALLFQPMLNLAKKASDLLFYKSEYTRRNALKTFSVTISNNLSLTEISDEFIEAVSRAMNPRRTALLLCDTETGVYSTFNSLQKLNPMEMTLNPESPIVRWLQKNNQCLTMDEIRGHIEFRSLWDSELQLLKDMEAEVLVPMKSLDSLVGIVLLTSKHNRVAYTLDDLDLLESLGASTAMALNNALLYAKAQENSYTDDMTGIYNRRYLYKYLNEKFEECRESQLSVIVFDLDRFKLYNELYGFAEGDAAIVKTGKIIRSSIDRRGIAARYSGEQFVAVLPYYDSVEAKRIAESVRERVMQAFFDPESPAKQFLTVSAGICTYPICASNVNELIQRGNLALFKAKENGKNMSLIYSTLQTYEEKKKNAEDASKLQATVYALTAAIDAKDHYTFSHSQNVATYARELARVLKFDDFHLDTVYEAGLLHDVGKIGIPENILTKESRLTDEEYAIVKKHVDVSINIVKHLHATEHVVPAIIGHHERWDGRGYPRGLSGENIPIEARCLSIVDTFDAITSCRPYKTPHSIEEALVEIERNAGTQFDPTIAKVFVEMVRSGVLKPTPFLGVPNQPTNDEDKMQYS